MTSLKVVIRSGTATRNHIKASYNGVKNRVKIVFDCPARITSAAAVAYTCREIYWAFATQPYDPDHPVAVEIDTGAVAFTVDTLTQYLRSEVMPPAPSSVVPTTAATRDIADDLVPRLLSWIEKHPNNSPDFYPVNDKEWQKVVNWVNSVTASKFTREDLSPVIQKLRKYTAP